MKNEDTRSKKDIEEANKKIKSALDDLANEKIAASKLTAPPDVICGFHRPMSPQLRAKRVLVVRE